MKKSLIAIAVASAFAAPAAMADTTLYGQAHVSLDATSAKDAAKDNESGVALASNSSRIGVKGSHKISEGLSAVYKIEWGVTMDGEAGTMSDRNRIVGLAGGFGTVVFGRHDTPVKVLGNKVAYDWGSTQLGGARALRSVKDGGAGFDLRADNVIGYISPNLGPVSIFAAYVTDHGIAAAETTTAGDNNSSDALSATITAGNGKPYLVGVGYEVHNVTGNPAPATESESVVRVAGAMNFGPFGVHGLYQSTTDVGFVDGASRDVYGLGAKYKMGKATLKGQYYIADDYDNGTGKQANTGASLAMVGADYKLGKTTDVYAQYAMIDNDTNAAFKLGGTAHGETATPATGETASGFSLGLRVKF